MCVLVAQLCPTLCDPIDCSPLGFCVHGILQARILECVAMPSSRGFSHRGIQPCSPALRAHSLLSESQGQPLLPSSGAQNVVPLRPSQLGATLFVRGQRQAVASCCPRAPGVGDADAPRYSTVSLGAALAPTGCLLKAQLPAFISGLSFQLT